MTYLTSFSAICFAVPLTQLIGWQGNAGGRPLEHNQPFLDECYVPLAGQITNQAFLDIVSLENVLYDPVHVEIGM